MILSRPVKPRARRTADMVASVPLLHRRTFWIDGKNRTISSAMVTSPSVGVPKLVPRSRAAAIAARIRGWLWPWIAGPQVQTKSISSRSSAVVRIAPAADFTKKGAAADGPEGPHRGIDPAGHQLQRAGEQIVGVRHGGDLS